MALVLDLEYSQSNNATTLTITDVAGTYNNPDNLTGWGTLTHSVINIVGPSDVTDYTPDKYHLLLDITVTDKDNVTTTYTQLNLYTVNGGAFALATDLVFDITPDLLLSGGVAMGEVTDKLDDGVYQITYQLVANHSHAVVKATFSEDVLVDGDVRIDVYNKLRQIPVDYDNEAVDTSRDVMEALLAYSYLQAMEASSAVAMTEELINMLYTLDKFVSDGSHYTW